jgi:hypothetical protein
MFKTEHDDIEITCGVVCLAVAIPETDANNRKRLGKGTSIGVKPRRITVSCGKQE